MIILNTRIWTATVEEAKAKAAASPEWVRAIVKADKQARIGKYWSFDATTGVLKVMSSSSSKLYTITADEHACEATNKGHKACWHKAMHRLMVRYLAKLDGVAAIECKHVSVTNWNVHTGHTITQVPRITVTQKSAPTNQSSLRQAA